MQHTPGYRVLLALSLVWSGGIFLPSALRLANVFPAGEVFARALYAPVCHQESERCATIADARLPVCNRCASVYLAFTATILLYPLFPRRASEHPPLGTFLLSLAPMAVDVGLASVTSWESTTASRLFTGGFAGAGLGVFLVPAWGEAWEQIVRQRTYTPSTEERAS